MNTIIELETIIILFRSVQYTNSIYALIGYRVRVYEENNILSISEYA